MAKKIGGWQRLWIVISGIYLIVVIIVLVCAGPRFPRPEEARYLAPSSSEAVGTNSFYHKLKPESRKKLAGHPRDHPWVPYLIADVKKILTNRTSGQTGPKTSDTGPLSDLSKNLQQNIVTTEQFFRVGGEHASPDYIGVIDLDAATAVSRVLTNRRPDDRQPFVDPFESRPIDFTLISEEDLSALAKKDFGSVSTPTLQYLRTGDENYLVTNVKMPNGDILTFRRELPEKEKEAVAKEYWNIVKAETNRKRLRYLFLTFLWFIAPVAALYGLGWSFGWVYKGFKER